MCRTYNTIGSLRVLKSQLRENNIHDFKSLKEVTDFQNAYTAVRRQLLADHESLIEQEKINLRTDLQRLTKAIEAQRLLTEQLLRDEIDVLKARLNSLTSLTPANFFQTLFREVKQWNYHWKINRREQGFDLAVRNSIRKLTEAFDMKNLRHQFIDTNFDDAVKQSAQLLLSELDKKKTTIDALQSFIYGALGEQKVVRTLETLSDEYVLINDFNVSFSPAIFNRQERDYIKSVQIDHIIAGPSGIFLLETKNWSETSVENQDLHSPVKQIQRLGFVLFKLLNNGLSGNQLRLDRHHWGEKKISVRNVIVLTNAKPAGEFQYAKTLMVNELPGYVNYFKPIFSPAETQRMADFLLGINGQKIVVKR